MTQNLDDPQRAEALSRRFLRGDLSRRAFLVRAGQFSAGTLADHQPRRARGRLRREPVPRRTPDRLGSGPLGQRRGSQPGRRAASSAPPSRASRTPSTPRPRRSTRAHRSTTTSSASSSTSTRATRSWACWRRSGPRTTRRPGRSTSSTTRPSTTVRSSRPRTSSTPSSGSSTPPPPAPTRRCTTPSTRSRRPPRRRSCSSSRRRSARSSRTWPTTARSSTRRPSRRRTRRASRWARARSSSWSGSRVTTSPSRSSTSISAPDGRSWTRSPSSSCSWTRAGSSRSVPASWTGPTRCPLNQLATLKNDPTSRTSRRRPPASRTSWRSTCSKPPFNNAKLRQAIAWAIDRTAVRDVAYFGAGEVGSEEVPSGSPWYGGNDPYKAGAEPRQGEGAAQGGRPRRRRHDQVPGPAAVPRAAQDRRGGP